MPRKTLPAPPGQGIIQAEPSCDSMPQAKEEIQREAKRALCTATVSQGTWRRRTLDVREAIYDKDGWEDFLDVAACCTLCSNSSRWEATSYQEPVDICAKA